MRQSGGAAAAASDGGGEGAIPAPPGVRSNIAHPSDAGMRGLNFAVQITAAAMVIGFFLIRCFSKWALRSQIRAEDWFFSVAFTLTLMYIGSIFAMYHYGDGYHAWDLTPERFRSYKEWLYVSATLYSPAACFTKFTLLLVMARVFAVKERVARGIYALIITMAVLYTPVQVVKTLMCVPIPAFWDDRIQPEFCFDSRKVFLADISLATFTDGVILVLPVALAWPLRLTRRKKVKIALLLGAGGGAVGTDLFRMYKLTEVAYETDTSAIFPIMTVLTTLELVTGFVCACVPPTKLLLERYLCTGHSPNSPRTPRTRIHRQDMRGAADFTTITRTGSAPTMPKHRSYDSGGVSSSRTTAPSVIIGSAPAPAPAPNRPESPDVKFHVDVERALTTGRPLSRITSGGGGGETDAAAAADKEGGPREWLRRKVVGASAAVRPQSRSRSEAAAAAAATASPSCAPHAAAEPSGITRTIEISLEHSDVEGPSSSRPRPRPDLQVPVLLPPPPEVAAATTAAAVVVAHAAKNSCVEYEGSRKKLIPGTVWDGRTADEETGLQSH